MLYVFASYLGNDAHMRSIPGVHRVLNAGGIQRVFETEELGVLEHSPSVQVTKETAGQVWISPTLLRLGITWRWWPKGFTFGNGVLRFKDQANYEMKTVVSGTDLTQDEYLRLHGPTRLDRLTLERAHVRHEGWQAYEARWEPGRCPQESHEVHTTGVITKYPLSTAALTRLRAVVEEGAPPDYPEALETPEEPGRYWSTLRPFKEDRRVRSA